MSVTIRSGLVAALSAVQAFLTENGVDAVVQVGWKKRRQHVNQGPGGANRVVFTPSGDDKGSAGPLLPPRFPGHRSRDGGKILIRPLLDWERGVLVSVWAADRTNPENEAAQIEATETLFEWVVRAIHSSPGAFASLTWGAATFTAPDERAFGLELRAGLSFRHPLYDAPQALAFPAGISVGRGAVLAPVAAPIIDGVFPSSMPPGSGFAPILLDGSGFVVGGSVYVDGVEVNSTFVTSGDVVAYVDQGALALGPHSVVYETALGAQSAPGSFTVATGGSNAAPTLASIGVSSVPATLTPLTNTATGSGFIASSTVYIGALPLQTTFNSATSLSFIVPASIVSIVALYAVTVRTGGPGGGTSGGAAFTVAARNPTLASLAPSSVTKNAVGVTLTCTGTGFDTDSVIVVDGVSRVTTFVNSTTVTCPAPNTIVGPRSVVVTNTGPGGATSSSQPFTVVYSLLSDGPEAIWDGASVLTSGSAITQVNDLTGNGYTAVQTSAGVQPAVTTLNGKPAVLCNNRALSIAKSLPGGARTTIMVRQLIALPLSNQTTCALNLKTSGRVFCEIGWSGNVAGGFTTYYTCQGIGGGAGSFTSVGHNAPQDLLRHVDICQFNGADSTSTSDYVISRDGITQTIIASGLVTATAANLQSIGARLLSGNTANGGGNFAWSLCVVWPRLLTPVELSDATTFVQANY